MPRFIVLYESSVGLSLFDCKGLNEVVVSEPQYQKQFIQYNLFHKLVQLETFVPFPSSEVALDTLQQLTEGSLSEFFRTFLTTAIAEEDAKFQGITLGVSDSKLAGSIASELGYSCVADSNTREIIRGIRQHFPNFIDSIKKDDIRLAELGLAHGYSRAKVKFNAHGDDNMIISSIVLLTTLDKDLNTFAMRLREWYSVYFPELSALIQDHATYAAAVQAVGFRDKLDTDALLNVLKDSDLVDKIKLAADNSIGREIDETDRVRIISMAERVEGLAQYRETLQGYLRERMHDIAPNLTSLVGERIGAQLIAASGSLTNLAKAPASTVQLLGAEKALFNALKKRKPTPKYGLIYNSAPVGAADAPNKGRTARSLANKISIAARMDAFGDDFRGGHLGALMKDMLQIRSEKIRQNKKPTPNFDAMVELQDLTKNNIGIKCEYKNVVDNCSIIVGTFHRLKEGFSVQNITWGICTKFVWGFISRIQLLGRIRRSSNDEELNNKKRIMYVCSGSIPSTIGIPKAKEPHRITYDLDSEMKLFEMENYIRI